MIPSPPPGSPAGAPAQPRSVLRDGSVLRLMFLGNMTEVLRWADLVAASVYVYQSTESALMVALLGFSRSIPLATFGPFIGALAERVDRRTLTIAYLGAIMATTAVLAVLGLTGSIAVWQVMLGTFLMGMFFSSDFALRRTMMSEIAGESRTAKVLGLDTSTRQIMFGAGPLLGGFLLETTGIGGSYAVATVVFGACLVAMSTMRFRPARYATSGLGFLASATEGLRYVRGVPLIAAVLVGTLVMNLLAFSYMNMVAVIGHDVLKLTPTAIGLLQSLEGIGSAVGAFTLAMTARVRYYGIIFFVGSILVCLGALLFSLSSSFVLSCAFMFLIGLGLSGFAVMQNTVMLIVAAPEMRSRAMGALTACIGVGPLGAIHIGLLADHFGATTAVTVVAVESLIGMALLAYFAPAIRRLYLAGEAKS